MRPEHQKSEAVQAGVRNPFDVMDVPNPGDQEVMDFASGATLSGSTDDENAMAWGANGGQNDSIEGNWASRWNGGADPTIAGDAKDKWKQGQAEVKSVGEQVYLDSLGITQLATASSRRGARAAGWSENTSI